MSEYKIRFCRVCCQPLEYYDDEGELMDISCECEDPCLCDDCIKADKPHPTNLSS